MSSVSTTTSGTTGAGGGNTIRITGMESGLDVDSLVTKMMAGEQTKLDKAKQDQQTAQWKQDAYQSIIKDVKDLQSSFFDSGSSDKNILSSSNFAPFTVSGVGTSTVDTSVATFTPGVGTKTGNYKITVTQLASGAGVGNTLNGNTLSTKLTDMGLSSSSINLVLNTGGSDINVTLDNTAGTSTLGDLVSAINNQASGSVKASFSELTGGFKLNTASTGSSTSLTIGSGTTAGLSSVLGSAVIGTTIKNGTDADVTITEPGGSAVTLNDTNRNAKTSNSFTIDGMNYNLSATGDASVSVGTDTQKVYDKIKGFIDKYNTIVDEIQTKLDEKKDSSYKPLTDAQKTSMSSTQITAWETKAKVGVLRNDDNLQNMLKDLRTAFTTSVSNAGLSLGRYGSNTLGIDTSNDYSTPGHIDISSEADLKAAISSKSDQILKLFTNVSTSTDTTAYSASSKKYQEDGIFTRIKSIIESNVGYTNTTLNTATLTSYANKQYDYTSTGSGGKGTIPDQLYEQQLQIKKITDQMTTDQEKYYQKFSNLETAMAQLSSQQSSLSSMLGSG